VPESAGRNAAESHVLEGWTRGWRSFGLWVPGRWAEEAFSEAALGCWVCEEQRGGKGCQPALLPASAWARRGQSQTTRCSNNGEVGTSLIELHRTKYLPLAHKTCSTTGFALHSAHQRACGA
jgi:hypothetical protein